ncbi:MAG: ABC transporter permease [Bacillota bacterium]|nr:MAG: ABC transporter permease [Bacillota bacterium]
MKESFAKIKFAWRYAYKNIFSHPMKSVLMVIGFLALFSTLLLGSTIPTFFKAYFYGEYTDIYHDLDLKMGVNPHGDTRFFQTRDLNDDSLDHVLVDYIPFFEIDLLLETEHDDRFYAHLYASTIEQFKKISLSNQPTSKILAEDEMIITSSLAKTYELSLNDQITLYSGDLSRTFEIIEIVEDGKLFRDQSIYIDKLVSFSFFLESLSPGLASLNPSLLVNIHNTVYLDVHPDIALEDAISLIKENTDYTYLDYSLTIDADFMDQMVDRNINVYEMIVSIVSITVILVLYTTLLVYFQDKKKMFAVIETLGGQKWFSFLIVIFEMLFFFILSLLLSVFATQIIINYGIKFLDSPITYAIPIGNIAIVSLILFIIFVLTTMLFFHRFNKDALIEQTKDSGHEVKNRMFLYALISSSSIIIYFLLKINRLSELLSIYRAPIQILLSILFILSFGSLSIQLITKIFNTKKKPFIFFLHLKILLSKKSFYQYMSVLLISILSIFLLILANDYMVIRRTEYREQYQLDFIVTNIIDDYELTYQEIGALDEVAASAKVGLYQDIKAIDVDEAIRDVVSIHPDDIDDFFNLEITDEAKQKLLLDEPIILLPERFRALYQLDIDDVIILDINPEYPSVSFIIGGFFKKQIGNLAIININSVTGYENLNNNAIFVNAASDKDLLNNQLLDAYSHKLIYILDYDQLVNQLVSDMEKATEYLNIIIVVILLCFVLSIINHSSLLIDQMRAVYARLYVLGYSHRKMVVMQIYESALFFIVMIISTLTSFILIGRELKNFVLFFGEYESISLTNSSIVYGLIISTLLFTLTKGFYILKTRHISVTDVIKIY